MVLSFYIAIVHIKRVFQHLQLIQKEPVTRFVGHCLRGSVYLGLETISFTTFPEPQKVTILRLSFSDEDGIEALQSSVTREIPRTPQVWN